MRQAAALGKAVVVTAAVVTAAVVAVAVAAGMGPARTSTSNTGGKRVKLVHQTGDVSRTRRRIHT